ncbi:MAG: hypothetical protein NT154_24715 [Verrucomicrobia bacterium]|nr:hypothetical protein [Verrucomicrobiota bacterium]
MLGLTLREEFRGQYLPATAISLVEPDGTGFTQGAPEKILSITYPTGDIQTALRAFHGSRLPRPLVLQGSRGKGKSHLLALLHHAIASPQHVENWANDWAGRAGISTLQNLQLPRGFLPISEPVHQGEFKFLWDFIFARHPEGQRLLGQFQASGELFPRKSILEEMFRLRPTALLLDEFQKWFDSLHDQPGATGIKWRTNAERFIQILSEIACEQPDRLIFAVSVLDNQTESFRQIHRHHPTIVNFEGASANDDRRKMVLHRLFENREVVPEADIRNLVSPYANERFRLLFGNLPEAERPRIVREVVGSWPFAPELFSLLNDQILVSTTAQDERDILKILTLIFRSRGEDVPVITPADFFVDEPGDTGTVQTLIDSIASTDLQGQLRDVAIRNLTDVRSLPNPVPEARELVSSIWLRSISPHNTKGGTREQLHLDITRAAPIDDNAFQGTLNTILSNCFKIHGENNADGRLYFDLEDNPRAKVRSVARNDRLWEVNVADVNQPNRYPGKDVEFLREKIRHMLASETAALPSDIIVLGPDWQNAPWNSVPDLLQPARWEKPVLIVLPAPIAFDVQRHAAALASWLIANVPARRNTLRFLLPKAGTTPMFDDAEVMFQARCGHLTCRAWSAESRYFNLRTEFDRPLTASLKTRFDRFAILRHWDFQNPGQCVFDLEPVSELATSLPRTIEDKIKTDIDDATEFETFVLQFASQPRSVGDLFRELAEPPTLPTQAAIPFLGDTQTYEELLHLAARGRLAINISNTWYTRNHDDDDEEAAYRRIKSRAFRSGPEQRAALIGLPGVAGGGAVAGAAPQPATAGAQPALSGTPGQTPTTPQPGTTPAAGQTPGQTTLPLPPVSVTEHTDTELNTISLIGKLEEWGIPQGAPLVAKVAFSDLTCQQLRRILQQIPSAHRANLEVTYEQPQTPPAP